MYYIIDRVEGNVAVCENYATMEMLNIVLSDIQDGAKEGDVVYIKDDKYFIDKEKTAELKNNIIKSFNSLWK